jgi:hypothetical protein
VMESPEASGVSVIRGEWVVESPGTGSGTEGSATIGAGMFETVEESSAWDASLTGSCRDGHCVGGTGWFCSEVMGVVVLSTDETTSRRAVVSSLQEDSIVISGSYKLLARDEYMMNCTHFSQAAISFRLLYVIPLNFLGHLN